MQEQAAKNNITLLGSEKIKEIVAEAIGINGNSIEYRKIELTSKDNNQYTERDANKHKKDYKKLINNNEVIQKPVLMQMEPVASTTTKVDHIVASYPVYKVACRVNNIKYRLSVDAVTGQVLNSEVIGD